MVMERADRLCQTADQSTGNDSFVREGMKCAAAFLKDGATDIRAQQNGLAKEELAMFNKGMVETFLRNIVLPREAEDISEHAMNGLVVMEQSIAGDPTLPGMLSECRSVLVRFIEHKGQIRQQLEEAFAQQMAQQMAQQDPNFVQNGGGMKMDPTLHPKFAEEWQKVLVSLNEQYGNALDQYKDAITKRLSA